MSDAQVSKLADPKTGEDVLYCGLLLGTRFNGALGYVAIASVSRVDGKSQLGVRPNRDIRLHVRKNPALGDPLPENTFVIFKIAEDDHPASKSGIEAVEAERTQPCRLI
ncbi:MAG: hypothetical protein V4474_03970 [Patescibacteria group bacterium]